MSAELKAKVTADTSQFNSSMQSIGASAVNVQAIAAGAILAIGAATFELGRRAILAAADMETLEVRLKQFTGSTASAKKEMKELIGFSAKTPFEPDEVVKASTALRALTENTLGGVDSLKLVGDAASKSGQSLDRVGSLVGRLYGKLKRGEPITEVANEMAKIGIMGGDATKAIQDVAKGGGDITKTWPMVEEELKKSKGAMQDLAMTFNGLVSTIKGLWKIALSSVGEGALEAAKDGLKSFIKQLEKLGSSKAMADLGREIGNMFAILNSGDYSVVDAIIGGLEILVVWMKYANWWLDKFVKTWNFLADAVDKVHSGPANIIFRQLEKENDATGRAAVGRNDLLTATEKNTIANEKIALSYPEKGE